jgi:RNA processing factor Prp31
LPDASFAEYEAAINRAAVTVETVKRSINLQAMRIKEIESLPFPVDLTNKPIAKYFIFMRFGSAFVNKSRNKFDMFI